MIYPDFRQSVSKIGESGGRLILGWQSESDIESAIGRAESRVIKANIRTRIYLRIDDDETAEMISHYSGTCKIKMRQSQGAQHTYATPSVKRSQTGIQVVEVDVPMIASKWLSQQPQGEAFMRMNGVLYRFSVPMRKDV